MSNDLFTIGIEEEYLLVDAETMELAEAPEEMISACEDELGEQVAPEFLRCQIEIGTKVCKDVGEARADLLRLRGTISRVARDYGLSPIAAACHPTADWSKQTHRDRERYNQLRRDLRAIGERMLTCGMHVHVGIPDNELRADLLGQARYFLPHMLALSGSSPYWQGRDTGLASYRIGVFDNLPRTGLPPAFESWAAYRRCVDALVDLEIIEDATKIWWDLRPSDNYPTLETRIFDVCPLMSHTLSLAAVTQCVFRMLWRLRQTNQRWRLYDRFLVDENRWRARRYGCAEGLIDLGSGAIKSMDDLVEEWIVLVAEDAEALGCTDEVQGLRRIIADGTSSMRQRATFAKARDDGASEAEAMCAVTRQLVEEFDRPPA